MLRTLLILFIIIAGLVTGGPSVSPRPESPPAAQEGPAISPARPEEAPSDAMPEAMPEEEQEPAVAEPEEEPAVEEVPPAVEAPAPADTPAPPVEEAPQEPISAENALLGDWRLDMDLAPAINAVFLETLREQGIDVEGVGFSELILSVTVTFFDDGSFVFVIDDNSAAAFVENLAAQLPELYYQIMQMMIDQNNLPFTVEELLEMSGISLDELVEQMLATMDPSQLVSTARGYYTLREDRIYIYTGTLDESVYDYYSIDGDVLTINHGSGIVAEAVGYGDVIEGVYPIVLVRIN